MSSQKSTADQVAADAPPAYEQTGSSFNQASRLGNADISELHVRSRLPNTSQGICHLKLLFAFSKLKEHITNLDGLFDIFNLPDDQPADDFEDLKHSRALLRIRIREKRWAVYVARAAYRFERWWSAMRAQNQAEQLKFEDMRGHNSKYVESVKKDVKDSVGSWMNGMMPPLGESSTPTV